MDTKGFQDQLADMWRTRPVRLPDNGHLAGVCAGIAVRYRVDPILIRVAFVASALFGGAGIMLYLAAWVLLVRHGDQVSPLESLVGRGASSDSSTKVIVILVGLAIATGAIGPVGAGSGGSGFIGTILMLGGWWLLYQRHPEPPVLPAPESESPFAQPMPFTPPFSSPVTAPLWVNGPAFPHTSAPEPVASSAPEPVPSSAPEPGSEPTVSLSKDEPSKDEPKTAAAHEEPETSPTETEPSTGRSAPVADPKNTSDASVDDSRFPAVGTPPAWDPLGVAPFAWDLPEPVSTRTPVPVEKKPRSRLTTTVLGLAVLSAAAAGTAAFATDMTWFTPARIGAIALAVIGSGLLVGAFMHRGHGLLVVTGPLMGFVILASLVGPIDLASSGQQIHTPRTAAELQDTYSVQLGDLQLDLRRLELTQDETIKIDTRLANTQIQLPADLDVDISCKNVAAGPCLMDGFDGGADGPGGPVLSIDIDTVMGSAEVHRG